MIATGDDQFRFGNFARNHLERLQHELQPLVGSPFSEGENAMDRISPAGEVGKLGPARENAMGAKMNVVAAILIVQDFSISWHQHRDRVRQQKHAGGDRAPEAVERFVPHAHILQLHRVHQVMQGYMGITSTQARKQRGHQSAESHEWILAKSTEQQVEPHHIRSQSPQLAEQTVDAGRVIKRPAPHNREALQFRPRIRQFVRQDRKAEEWVALELLGNMESIFGETSRAWRKGGDQTDLHSSPILEWQSFDVHSEKEVAAAVVVRRDKLNHLKFLQPAVKPATGSDSG